MPSAPGTAAVEAEWVARHVVERGRRGIHDAIAALIDSGELPPQTRLPTVRDLAGAVGVTASTVAEAWSALRREGYVQTRRRGGTAVIGPAATATRSFEGWTPIELMHAQPDAALLPSIDRALASAVHPGRRLFAGDTVTASVESVVGERWPFVAEQFTTVPTGNLALRLALRAASSPRGLVAVEDPTLLRSVTALAHLGIDAVPVSGDDSGPLPASLAAALAQGASVFVYQPHGGIPVGRRLTPERRDALAEVLSASDPAPWIVEEHPAGGLCDEWDLGPSLGTALPARTVRLTQYWRAYGTDLEFSVLGGSRELIAPIVEAQTERGLRTSPLLQDALAALLVDPDARSAVRTAAATYERRRRALAAALSPLGLRDEAVSGLFCWIPVADEQRTVAHLSALGVHVVAGATSRVGPRDRQHVRVAVTRLPDDPLHVEELAAAIALAAGDGVLP